MLSYELEKHPRAIKIAKTLAKHGYRVKLWSARKPFTRGPRILRVIMNYLLAFLEVLNVRADIYWVENIPDVVYLSLPIMRRRYIYDRRSPWTREIEIEFGSKMKRFVKVFEMVERFLMSRALAISVVSRAMKYEYSFDKPIAVVPNYPEKSFLMNPEENLRQKLGIPENRKIFLYVGKLSIVEGIDILRDAGEKVCNDDSVEIWIVGDGPDRKVIENIIKECNNVRWFGWVPRREIGKYIASADYGLVPRHRTRYRVFYNHEGIQKIGEYFAYGKPVITCGIAPSPFYLNVEPEEFGEAIIKVAKGMLKPPDPPTNLYWESVSEPRLLDLLKQITAFT